MTVATQRLWGSAVLVAGLLVVRSVVTASGPVFGAVTVGAVTSGVLLVVGVGVGIGVVDGSERPNDDSVEGGDSGDGSGSKSEDGSEPDSGRESDTERDREREAPVGTQSPAAAAASLDSSRWRRTYATKFSKTPLASQAAR